MMTAADSSPFPDIAAAQAARTIALQMLEERGRGAVLVGMARVDAALEHLLQAVLAPATANNDGLFLPDRPLGSIGAKVALASRLGLIDAGVEQALNALRKLRNAFAHSTESASLADPLHSSRLVEVYELARANPLWRSLETVLAAQPASAHGCLEPDHHLGGFSRCHCSAAQAIAATAGDGAWWYIPAGRSVFSSEAAGGGC